MGTKLRERIRAAAEVRARACYPDASRIVVTFYQNDPYVEVKRGKNKYAELFLFSGYEI